MKVLAGLIYDVELEAVWDTECSALLDKLLMALPVEWDDQLIEILPLLEVGLAELARLFSLREYAGRRAVGSERAWLLVQKLTASSKEYPLTFRMNWEIPYHLVEREETAEVSRRAEMN